MPKSEGGRPGAGRPMISREFLDRARRERFVAPAADLAHEFGPWGVTVGHLVRRVGTSRNTFYAVYADRWDCLRFALDEARERLLAPVREADEGGEWVIGLRDAVAGFYRTIAAEPNLGELLLIHSFAIEPIAEAGAFEGAVGDLRRLIGRGRDAGGERASRRDELADEYFARGTLLLASQALLRGEAAELPRRAGELAPLIASAYLEVSEVAPILPRR